MSRAVAARVLALPGTRAGVGRVGARAGSTIANPVAVALPIAFDLDDQQGDR